MRTHLLDEASFAEAFYAPMTDVTSTQVVSAALHAADIWSYVDHIPPEDYGGREVGDVTHVWEDGRGWFWHVVIETNEPDVVLVLIMNGSGNITGHHLLNLKGKYGLG